MKANTDSIDNKMQLVNKLGVQVETDLVDYIDERYITRVARTNNII